jgi:eukaryotic-like serine/threonine-protein kinase
MKLVQGVTLAEGARRPLTESAALGIFERVVDAVAFAHTRGVIHRDLKPSNIMIGPFGEVLVMDWGVAKILDSRVREDCDPDDPSFEGGTQSGTRMGTPGFMSPEQADGNVAAVSPASDVFALGAVLSWLITGETPEHRARPSRRLRAIVAKCLAPSPADRYVDAVAVAGDLARYRAGEAVDALPETVIDRAVRVAGRHRTLIVLVAAYLVMRAIVAALR